jgi:hypothetical protein
LNPPKYEGTSLCSLRHPEITDELAVEGFRRGFLLQLQVQRKEIGLEIGAIALIASQWYGYIMKKYLDQ